MNSDSKNITGSELRDVLGRVALAREALVAGDIEFAADLLRDLELDVATVTERIRAAA